METTTIRIPPEMGVKLNEIARRNGEYMTVLAKRMGSEFIERDERKQAKDGGDKK